LRLGWAGKLAGTASFFAPLIWLGFSPLAITAAVATSLLYPFWLHPSFVEERSDVQIRCGLTTPLLSHNPLPVATHGDGDQGNG